MAPAQPSPRHLATFLFDPRGAIGRVPFALACLLLSSAKLLLDYGVARQGGSPWSLLDDSLFGGPLRSASRSSVGSSTALAIMLVAAVPVCLGRIICRCQAPVLRRCAGLAGYFFFVPIAQFLLFGVVVCLPPQTRIRETARSPLHRGRTWRWRRRGAPAGRSAPLS